MGERSALKLMSLEHQIQSAQATLDDLAVQRQAIEHKVVQLRPETLNPDMLEERARVMLGYGYQNEKIMFLAN